MKLNRRLAFRLLFRSVVIAIGLTVVSAATAQPGEFALGQGLGFGDANAEKVFFSESFETTSEPGKGVLVIRAEIQPGWHIFTRTQKKGKLGGPESTTIKIDASQIYQLDPTRETSSTAKPKIKRYDHWPDIDVEEIYGNVMWRVPIEYTLPADTTTFVIKGVVDYQKCDPNVCIPSKHEFAVTADTTLPPPKPTQAGAAGGFDPTALSPIEYDEVADWPIWKAIVFGFLGGLILNLMPCVLPVIGLKIFAFIEQSGKSRTKSFVLNVWYSLGIISVFMVLAGLAVFAQLGWGELFRYAEFNIALAAIVFAMGLSFLGVWEIPIPGFIGSNKVAEIGAKEGYEGAFAKGTITTLLATPCTGPFLGSALAWAVLQPAPLVFASFFSVGLGMASPYLLIGAFPELVRFLPKPGAWMDTFKQFMGFLLLGTVIYLLTLLEPLYIVPTVGLLFAMWMACWWIGRVPVTASPDRRWRAVGEGATVSVLVGVMAFYWLAPLLNGRYYPDQIIVETTPDEEQPEVAHLDWKKYTPGDLAADLNSGKTTMVDFTANWCPNCLWLEGWRLNTVPTRQLVDELGVVSMRADWSHQEKSPEVSKLLTQLGAKQIPVLAIFPAGDPQRPIVLRGVYSMEKLHDSLRKAAATESGAGPEAIPDRVAKSE